MIEALSVPVKNAASGYNGETGSWAILLWIPFLLKQPGALFLDLKDVWGCEVSECGAF